MDADELRIRTKRFGLRCLKVADSLPRSNSGRIIAGQLGRCSTSVGSNYRAACRARSRQDFIYKIGIVEEEADESAFWIEMIADSAIKPKTLVGPLLTEANELVQIMVASARTARARLKSIRNSKSAIRNT